MLQRLQWVIRRYTAVMLVGALWLCLAATHVSLLDEPKLRALTKTELRVHLHDVEDELDDLRRGLSMRPGEVMLNAGARVGPFVLVTCVPALAVAVLLGPFSGAPSGVLGSALFIALGSVLVGVISGLVYIVGQLFEHAVVEVPALTARGDVLLPYHERVAGLLEAR